VKSRKLGRNTSNAEIQAITPHGIWLLVNDHEYFLAYGEFPWFKQATVEQISHVVFLKENHLHWPELDVDLELDCLKNLEKYPLVYKTA